MTSPTNPIAPASATETAVTSDTAPSTRSQDEDEGVEPPDVETHLPRLILAEEHQIELLRIPQYDN